MRVRFLVAAGVASLAVWSAGCEEIQWDHGLCEDDADCEAQVHGTWCSSHGSWGSCRCLDPNERVCCPGGVKYCATSDIECRPRAECDQPPVVMLAAPGEPCLAAEDCRGPIDPRCGAVLCDAGKCRFEIDAGEKSPSQTPGDCKLNICNYNGDVDAISDVSDAPLTGNPCSWDACDGGETTHKALDGVPCPGSEFAFCFQGTRFDCSEVLGFDNNCPSNLLCDWDTCVPANCKDGVVNGTETAKDCGGPSCRRCEVGDACMEHADCFSNSCVNGMCQEATHSDGRQNADETGIDCGYPNGPLHMCKDGDDCRGREDCMSDVCYLGKCLTPTCTDDRKNGAEVETDCGGTCPPCPP